MIDCEKVVEGLEQAKNVIEQWVPMFEQYNSPAVIDEAIALLKQQETVVRCHDCKYCEYPTSEKKWCKKGHLHGKAETWFCGDGERRTDDD